MNPLTIIGLLLFVIGLACIAISEAPLSVKAQLPIAPSYSQGDIDLAVRSGIILGQQMILQYQDEKRQAEHILEGKKEEADLNNKYHTGLQLSWDKETEKK